MTGLDLFIIAILAIGLIRGLFSGAIKQILQIAGLILAFLLAWHAGRPVGEMLGQTGWAVAIGFLVVFVAVQVLTNIATKAMEGLLGALKLSALNRVMGGAVGAIRSALVLSGIFLALAYVGAPSAQSRSDSVFYQPVTRLLPATFGIAKEKLGNEINRYKASRDNPNPG